MSETKSTSTSLEKIAFSITRIFVAVLTVLSLIVMLYLFGSFAVSYMQGTSVSYSEVLQQQYGGGNNNSNRVQSVGLGRSDSVSIPLSVSVWFNDHGGTQILDKWLSGLSASEKQDFVKGVENIILAEKNSNRTSDLVNTYRSMWFAKRTAGASSWELQQKPRLIAGGIGLAVFSVLSMILALLAIERNTRQNNIENKPATNP